MATNIKKIVGLEFQYTCQNQVSARAFREVRDMICGWHGLGYGQVEPYMNEIGSSWDAVDKTKAIHGTNGTWPKRLSSYLYKKGICRLSDNEKAQIGEVASRGRTTGTFFARVVPAIEWDRGDFGDGGSCFWGDRDIARKIIPFNGGGALQWFKDSDRMEGCARSMILPARTRGYVLFNAYGHLSLEAQADGLAQALDLTAPYQIDLTDNGIWSPPDFWINGGKGIVVPTRKLAVTISKKIDMHLKRPHRCYRCGQYEPEATGQEANGHWYCTNHLPRERTCTRCGGRFYDDSNTYEGMCRQCFYTTHTTHEQCHVCGTYYSLDSGQEYCDQCTREYNHFIQNQTPRRFTSNREAQYWMTRDIMIRPARILQREFSGSSLTRMEWANHWLEEHSLLDPNVPEPAPQTEPVRTFRIGQQVTHRNRDRSDGDMGVGTIMAYHEQDGSSLDEQPWLVRFERGGWPAGGFGRDDDYFERAGVPVPPPGSHYWWCDESSLVLHQPEPQPVATNDRISYQDFIQAVDHLGHLEDLSPYTAHIVSYAAVYMTVPPERTIEILTTISTEQARARGRQTFNTDIANAWSMYPGTGNQARARFLAQYLSEHPEYRHIAEEIINRE